MPSDESARITEDDREATLVRIKDAFVAGSISHEELDEHLQSILSATTHHDLVPVLASLPGARSGRTVTLTGKSGRFRRRGAWRVPRVLRIESLYGKVDLDLSQAVIEDPVVTIDLQLRYGRARITVPADAVVDIEGLRTVWKQTRYQHDQRLDLPGRRIQIIGTMEYGRLKIRHKAR